MINWSYTKRDGQFNGAFLYEYKTSWGKRYYSFDGGDTWHTSKADAFAAARNTGRLRARKAA